jgi:transposase
LAPKASTAPRTPAARLQLVHLGDLAHRNFRSPCKARRPGRLGYTPVVPPLSTRIEPWEYDREMYKRRNEVERLFRRLKGYRRIFSRFEKLDVMFLAFICFALIADGLR